MAVFVITTRRARSHSAAAVLVDQDWPRAAELAAAGEAIALDLHAGIALAWLGDPAAEAADELIVAVSEYRGVPEVEELRELGAQRRERHD